MLNGGYAVGSVDVWYEEPVFAVGKVLGQLCGAIVEWRTENSGLDNARYNDIVERSFATGNNNEFVIVTTYDRLVVGADLSSVTYNNLNVDDGSVLYYPTVDGTEYAPLTLTFEEIGVG